MLPRENNDVGLRLEEGHNTNFQTSLIINVAEQNT